MNNLSNISLERILYILQNTTRPNIKNMKEKIGVDLSRSMFFALLFYLYPNEDYSVFFDDKYTTPDGVESLQEKFSSANFSSQDLNSIKPKISFCKQSVFDHANRKKDGKLMLVRIDNYAGVREIDDTDLFNVLHIVTESCKLFQKYAAISSMLLNEISTTSSQYLLSCAFKGVFKNNRIRQAKFLSILEDYISFNTHKLYMFSLVEKDVDGEWLFMEYDKNDELCQKAVELIKSFYENVFFTSQSSVEIGAKFCVWVKYNKDLIGDLILNHHCYDAGVWDWCINKGELAVLSQEIKERLLNDIPQNIFSASEIYRRDLFSLLHMLPKAKDNFHSLYYIKSDSVYNENFKKMVDMVFRSLGQILKAYPQHINVAIVFINQSINFFSRYSSNNDFIKQLKSYSFNYAIEPYSKIIIKSIKGDFDEVFDFDNLCGEWTRLLYPKVNHSKLRPLIYGNLLSDIPENFDNMSDSYGCYSLLLFKQNSRLDLVPLLFSYTNPAYNESFKKYFRFVFSNAENFLNKYPCYEKAVLNFCKKVIKHFAKFSEHEYYLNSLIKNIDTGEYPYKNILGDTYKQIGSEESLEMKTLLRTIVSGNEEQEKVYLACSKINKNARHVDGDSEEWQKIYSDFLRYLLDNYSDDPRCFKTIVYSIKYYNLLDNETKERCVDFSVNFLRECAKNTSPDSTVLWHALKLSKNYRGSTTDIYEDIFPIISNQPLHLVNELFEVYGVANLVSKLCEEGTVESQTHYSNIIRHIISKREIRKRFQDSYNENNDYYNAFIELIFSLLEFETFVKLNNLLKNSIMAFAKTHNLFKPSLTRLLSFLANDEQHYETVYHFLFKDLTPEELNSIDIKEYARKYKINKENLIYHLCKINKNNPEFTAVLCIKALSLLLGDLTYNNLYKTDNTIKKAKMQERRKLLFKTAVANPCIKNAVRQYCLWLRTYAFATFDEEGQAIVSKIINKKEYPEWFDCNFDSFEEDSIKQISVNINDVRSFGENCIENTDKIKSWLDTQMSDETAYTDPHSVVVVTKRNEMFEVIDGNRLINSCRKFADMYGNFKVNVWLFTPAKSSEESFGESLPSAINPTDIMIKQLAKKTDVVIAKMDAHDKKMSDEIKELRREFCERISLFVQDARNRNKENLDALSMHPDTVSILNTQISKMFAEITSKINMETISDDSCKNSRAYLQGLFGDNWYSLSKYTQTALVSGHVLLEKSKDMDIDFSGVVIPICSALENEIKQIFYFGLQKWLNQDEIYKWPKQLKYWDKEKHAYEANNGNWLTIGAIKYYLGLEKPEKDYYETKDHEYLEKTLTKYIREVFHKPDFEIEDLRNMCDRLDKIREDYRNPAAHTGEMNLEKATDCVNEVIGSSEACKQMGAVQGVLLELMILLSPKK